MVSRVPDASRGRRVAQSDGLVCLIILSADGHPKPKRSTWSRASAFPTAPNSRLPPKNLHLLFAPFFKGKSKSSRKQKNKKTKKQKKKVPPISSKYKNSPVLVESFFIFRNKAVAARFGI